MKLTKFALFDKLKMAFLAEKSFGTYKWTYVQVMLFCRKT